MLANSCGRAQTRYASVSKCCPCAEAQWVKWLLQGMHQSLCPTYQLTRSQHQKFLFISPNDQSVLFPENSLGQNLERGGQPDKLFDNRLGEGTKHTGFMGKRTDEGQVCFWGWVK